jgi:hypothetical protein
VALVTSFLERITKLLLMACLTYALCGVLAFVGFWIQVYILERIVVYYSAADQQALCTQWTSAADRMPWCQNGEQFNDEDLESWLNANYRTSYTRHSEVVSLFAGWSAGVDSSCTRISHPQSSDACPPPDACRTNRRNRYSCWFELPETNIYVTVLFTDGVGSVRLWQVRNLSSDS